MNHSQRIAHVARERRAWTKAMVQQIVNSYWAALADEIASGETVELPGIGRIQVVLEEGTGYVTSITPSGARVRRKVKWRLRTKVRLSELFKRRCRGQE